MILYVYDKDRKPTILHLPFDSKTHVIRDIRLLYSIQSGAHLNQTWLIHYGRLITEQLDFTSLNDYNIKNGDRIEINMFYNQQN